MAMLVFLDMTFTEQTPILVVWFTSRVNQTGGLSVLCLDMVALALLGRGTGLESLVQPQRNVVLRYCVHGTPSPCKLIRGGSSGHAILD